MPELAYPNLTLPAAQLLKFHLPYILGPGLFVMYCIGHLIYKSCHALCYLLWFLSLVLLNIGFVTHLSSN
ncbi:hypothetical protein BZA77DRAFT_149862 [Pyronema omphalodes]|nr:hypothetical protein BZA77DRAFT_149862 [Pyronema omphalodes]